MNKREIAIMLFVVLVPLSVFSLLPIFPDPYYHKEKVNFWVWLRREIDELKFGER